MVSVSFIFVSVFCTWLPQVRKCSGKINFLQGQGRLREFHSESGKIEVRQSEILRVRLYILLTGRIFFMKVKNMLMLGFERNEPCQPIIKEPFNSLTLHVTC